MAAKNGSRVQALSSVSSITLAPGRRRTPPVVRGHGTVAGPPAVAVAGSPGVPFGRRVRQAYHAEEVLHDDDSRAFKSPLIRLSLYFFRRSFDVSAARRHFVFADVETGFAGYYHDIILYVTAATVMAIDTDRYYITREYKSSAHKSYINVIQ